MAVRRCSYAGMQQQQQLIGPDGIKRAITGVSNIDSLWTAIYSHQQQQNHRSQGPSRRASRSNDVSADIICSQQSVLNAMDRFVKAVNNMDATVLVPSRLRDMEITEADNTAGVIGAGVSNPPRLQADLHSCFAMLHEAKNELLWGTGNPAVPHLSNGGFMGHLSNLGSSSPNAALRVPSVTSQPSHKRQASDGSLGSATSSDPETDNDCSSLSDFADAPAPEGGSDNTTESVTTTAALSSAFRVHLHALHAILQQMADSADYLSNRYQNELEPSNGSK
ncbi:uncharacterized protein LOC111265604 [Varroa jacobsoni]|uniref:Mid1-interacting protein n=1 Tax=Varroa destructor TaxID=109461 RepID=A0A7M7KI65_VARDE|nr:uncharacterized protein LOC111252480 [Varroa destructor]XP_022666191.1 uncharacterized protein LOC111252480 [Varroa destructor]XP_022666192.1 uncharacterized protein LOC111252480 [Varroa destructor]XP_022666193.1 uncharacterized protein LOC111252480 [Varroa destructor]XP_022698152.1 uncharacterized protein LOC111265604 [Varroa jacobsoni]XP_022698153.1 uncharacterized protein LOC111265604 [Varroa jacobsoni]